MNGASLRRAQIACVVLLALGALAFAVAFSVGDAARVWEAFLVNLLFWLGIAQGGVIVSAALYLTEARWGGASLYRLAESFAGFLPLGFLLFWVLFPGREIIFSWIDHPIPAKSAWLNVPFLFSRDGGGLLLMTLLSFAFLRVSRGAKAVQWAEVYETIDHPPPAIRRLAPVLILAFVVVYSILAFDLVMSLSPIWYSTLFGAFFFAGAFWSALVAMGLLAVLGWTPVRRGKESERSGIYHDLGKLVFAFSVFWAYLMWSQYLPIWYAAIPEESFFVVVRVHVLPWSVLAWTTLALVWVIPFLTLLGRKGKQTPAVFGTVCALGLIGMWLEQYLLITPSLSPKVIPYGWVEPLITAGFLGVFGLCTLPGLQRMEKMLAREVAT